MFAKVKDEKAKEELIKEFSKRENVDELKQFLERVYPILRASEQDEEEKPAMKKGRGRETGAQQQKAKSKGASLPTEPHRVTKGR